MIKVYTPHHSFDIFYDWFGTTDQFTRCDSINEVCNQDIKIACVPLFFDNELSIPVEKFDLFLISDIEFNHVRPINDWLERMQIPNYLVAVGGLEEYTVSGNMIYRPWWTFNLMSCNHDRYKELNSKPYIFDMLLGMKKPHRDWILARAIETGLESKSICTYRDVFNVHNNGFTDKKLLVDVPYPFISKNLRSEFEVSDNINFQISDQVPWGIYEQTQYSVVAESLYENVFFFTEKPAKVIFAKRLFVVFSCHNYLKQMKEELGFKTFDCIIDESYDQEKNTVKRFEMAFEQMLKLSKMNFFEVQIKTKEIREFNYRRLFELRQEKNLKMREMVYNKIEEIKC